MKEAELGRLVRKVSEARGDLSAWIELARGLARTGARPMSLRSEENLEHLLELWRQHPAERNLSGLLDFFFGLEPVGPDELEPDPSWYRSRRLGSEGDHYYDLESGLPLHVRVRSTGDLLTLRVKTGHWAGVDTVTGERLLDLLGRPPAGSGTASSLRWYDNAEYCWVLTEREELAGRLAPGWEYRLPNVGRHPDGVPIRRQVMTLARRQEVAPDELPELRCDGLYLAEGYVSSRKYWLRFHHEGVVITTVTEGGDPEQIAPWFQLGNPMAAAGHFRHEGRRVEFQTRVEADESAGFLRYTGFLTDAGHLRMKVESDASGHASANEWRFVPFGDR